MKTLKSIFNQCWFRAKYVYEILFVEFLYIFFRIPHIILDIYGCAKNCLKTKVFLKTVSKT
jgi:hypothetical protein